MKTAIYINEGVTQVVLTPETDWERNIVAAVEESKRDVKIKTGEFARF